MYQRCLNIIREWKPCASSELEQAMLEADRAYEHDTTRTTVLIGRIDDGNMIVSAERSNIKGAKWVIYE